METIKEIIEIIYLICAGPLIAFLIYKGLEQIKVAKESSKLNSKREAFKVAAEQCNHYKDCIIPLAETFSKEKKDLGIEFFDKFESQLTEKGIETKLIGKIDNNDFKKLEKLTTVGNLMNSLEGYALYFASKVADEKVAFITTGKSYCNIVEDLLPMIAPSFNNGYYKNITYMYMIWKTRLQKEELKKEQKKIEEKLKNQKEFKIKPIGT